jgi:hypothetical protein
LSKKVNISIPKPCHENWEAMTPEDKGRFCSVCTKTVFDLTKATDKEIIEHLKKDKNACGRFYKNQLSQDLVINKYNSNYWTIFTFSLVGLFGFGNHNVYSQVKQDTVQTEKNTDIKDQNNQPKYRKIKGNVYDELGGIAGAHVITKRSNNKTVTDMEGNFEIEVKNNDILEITYEGKITEEILISDKKILFVKLIDSTEVGKDVIIGGYKTKSSLEIQVEKIMNWFR